MGVNSRKNTPISYIRMRDQRDWFPVETDGPKKGLSISSYTLRGLDYSTGFFYAQKTENFEGNTDPMKVCAITGVL